MANSLNKLDDKTLKLIKEAKREVFAFADKITTALFMLVIVPSAALLEPL